MKRMIAFAIVAAAALVACAAQENTPQRTEPPTVSQCWAMTQSGNRCKRRARPGERYCKQHSSQKPTAKNGERCRSMTEDGKQCEEKSAPGRRYCKKH